MDHCVQIKLIIAFKIQKDSSTKTWFRANQYLLFLLNAACLAEKQQIPIFTLFGLSQSALETKIYHTL